MIYIAYKFRDLGSERYYVLLIRLETEEVRDNLIFDKV
jgi:hypothetical protein